MTDATDKPLALRLKEALGDDYTIEGEIGRGGMGVVFRARDERLQRRIAIKVLPPELAFQREIKEYSALRSNLKLRMSLIRDYLAWVTQEARGNQVLSREVREWFEEHIAPRKEDPIVPRELRGLASRQLKSKLDDTERAPASAERTYRAAMLRWLLEPDSEQNLKQQVLPLLEEAMMKSPENLDFVYSAGALHKRARHFARAIECFNRYASEARQSWWSRKAVELCAACR